MHPMWDAHPMWGAWSGWGMLLVLAFWTAVIAVLVLVLRWLVTGRGSPGTDRALAILRQRYARGEITKDEFETRRRDLDEAA